MSDRFLAMLADWKPLDQLPDDQLHAEARTALRNAKEFGRGGKPLDDLWFEFVRRQQQDTFRRLQAEANEEQAAHQRRQVYSPKEQHHEQ